jgi:hypothetical protein
MEWIYDEQGRPERHKDVLVATLDSRNNKVGYMIMSVGRDGEWLTDSWFTKVIAWSEIEGFEFQEGTPDTPRDVLIKIMVDKKIGQGEKVLDDVPEEEQEVGYMVYGVNPATKRFDSLYRVVGWSDFDYLTKDANGTPLIQTLWNAQKK